MIARLRQFQAADGGASAVEFAMIISILCGMLLFGVNTWLRLSHTQDAATALHTGARYFQDGGADDDAARTLALAGWPRRPSDATLTVSRSCTCGDRTVSCTTICDDDAPPQSFVTLTARSTFRGFEASSLIERQETLRVR